MPVGKLTVQTVSMHRLFKVKGKDEHMQRVTGVSL